MAKEECLSKEKIIDQIGILKSLEKIEVLHRHKDDKTFEIKLTFYVAKCLLAVSLENEYLNLLIINLTIKTSRNLIKGCHYLLDNLTVV